MRDKHEPHKRAVGQYKARFIGTYNWWSKKHLKIYLNEFTLRYNTRKWKEDKRFFLFLQNVFERITQRDITDNAWTL